jgi:predicted acetyltransferase
VHDETWLRVVDVAQALSRRTYAGTRSVTVQIEDPLLSHNCATFAISADGVQTTSNPAQLVADIAGLGAALLGGTSWRDLASAGLVAVHDPMALAAADELFAVPQAPYAGFIF